MRGNIVRKSFIVLISLFVMFVLTISYAHSGRTDSSGGHKDNKNKSGLGNYHYHCGGNPPHLHTDGYCPYSSSGMGSQSSYNNKDAEEPKPIVSIKEEIEVEDKIIKNEIDVDVENKVIEEKIETERIVQELEAIIVDEKVVETKDNKEEIEKNECVEDLINTENFENNEEDIEVITSNEKNIMKKMFLMMKKQLNKLKMKILWLD